MKTKKTVFHQRDRRKAKQQGFSRTPRKPGLVGHGDNSLVNVKNIFSAQIKREVKMVDSLEKEIKTVSEIPDGLKIDSDKISSLVEKCSDTISVNRIRVELEQVRSAVIDEILGTDCQLGKMKRADKNRFQFINYKYKLGLIKSQIKKLLKKLADKEHLLYKERDSNKVEPPAKGLDLEKKLIYKASMALQGFQSRGISFDAFEKALLEELKKYVLINL